MANQQDLMNALQSIDNGIRRAPLTRDDHQLAQQALQMVGGFISETFAAKAAEKPEPDDAKPEPDTGSD